MPHQLQAAGTIGVHELIGRFGHTAAGVDALEGGQRASAERAHGQAPALHIADRHPARRACVLFVCRVRRHHRDDQLLPVGGDAAHRGPQVGRREAESEPLHQVGAVRALLACRARRRRHQHGQLVFVREIRRHADAGDVGQRPFRQARLRRAGDGQRAQADRQQRLHRPSLRSRSANARSAARISVARQRPSPPLLAPAPQTYHWTRPHSRSQ